MTASTSSGFHMIDFSSYRRWPVLLATSLLIILALASPSRAAEEEAPKGPAVTVLKATKSCFANIVELSGTVMPREETAVRPERMGLKVAEVLAEAGDTVTAGQTLARLNLPEGGTVTVQAPVAGTVSVSNAVVGAMASGKGEALFNLIARNEYDLVGLASTSDLPKLANGQPASIRVIGIGDVDARVRRISPTVEPAVQLGPVYIGITTNRRLPVNASGRALIKTGQSCGVAVPLTAIQYSAAGTVVQVVKRQRIETKRVETGLMSGGSIEIRDGLNEGEDIVARAGSLLREGDLVRPVAAAANAGANAGAK
jgi:multidrug efflux pump subunit AcrA (membrane-fusion protein)